MRKIEVLIVFLILISVSLVNAQEIDFLAKIDLPYNVSIPCSLNDYNCPSTTDCNISLLYPNSTSYLIPNQEAEIVNSFVSYTIPENTLNVIGDYNGFVFCTENNLNASTSFILRVNPLGEELTISQVVMYIGLFAFAIFLFALFLYGSIVIKWNNPRNDDGAIMGINDMKYIKLFLMVLTYLSFLALSFISYQFSYAFLYTSWLTSMFKTIYQTLAISIYPLILLGMCIALIVFIKEAKIKKTLERGLFPR